MVRIAIDAMGGDFGHYPIVEGAIFALKQKTFLPIFVGDENKIAPLIPKKFKNRVEIVHCSDVIAMDEHATDALKRRDSSIYKAVDLVRQGKADAVVSAGHSGATMSLATLRIGRIKGISRPAIATFMPTQIKGKQTIVLDVGANVDCDANNLFQFAVMGDAYASEVLGSSHVKVGLLSNGEEATKGNEVTKEAYPLISQLDSFVGNVEGGDIFSGDVDVVVCDGFVGNVLLKTSEGVAETISYYLKSEIKRSPISIAGALLMKRVFRRLKKQIDYAEYGGAPLLGVKACTIISHGKSNPKAIKNAMFQAIRFVESDVNEAIRTRLEALNN
ncbi:phosphate acyltransferase PlsX [Hydrogenimonas sp.]|jgi:glycerol-3-phosphate acyltransferase PlsX|uniref:phosphate acyltransferase PlsX n=1 Tax=Hydrogenimonas sp. TaxID=2231112 RepID=UPI0026335D0D|nr:phosphate acyltransferase PlsX [Hydrogenimonas sp.]